MLEVIARALTDPRLDGVDVDSAQWLDVQREILESKPMMRGVLCDFYQACLQAESRHFTAEGKRVEIGAGISLFKHYCSDLISTDIKPGPGLDMVVDALDMPFTAGSIRSIFGINCFHHLPSPDRFFQELDRTLAPGGGCVLIEPYYGPVARPVFRRLFASETFDRTQPGWTAPSSAGVMSGANQALSFIVFVRDRHQLTLRHPTLEIVSQTPLTNYMRYVLSGGLNFRSIAPSWSEPLLRGAEWLLSPLKRLLALHHLVVLRKRR
jgi:SAM-dependent methyltransferase